MPEIDGQVLDPDAAENVIAGRPAPQAPAEKKFSVTDDGNLVEVDGKKYYREEALHNERQKAQQLTDTINQLAPLMPEFNEFLEAKKAGRTATVARATRATESDYSDDELDGYAITRGYFEGGDHSKPDRKRAKDDLDIMTAIADRRAGRAVQPVAEGALSDRARENMEYASNYRLPQDGEPVASPEYVRSVIDALPANVRADRQQVEMALVLAAGLEALDARKKGQRQGRREPVFREGGGQRVSSSSGDQLDALDRAAARARGRTPDQWTKLQKDLGGSSATGTVLEEV